MSAAANCNNPRLGCGWTCNVVTVGLQQASLIHPQALHAGQLKKRRGPLHQESLGTRLTASMITDEYLSSLFYSTLSIFSKASTLHCLVLKGRCFLCVQKIWSTIQYTQLVQVNKLWSAFLYSTVWKTEQLLPYKEHLATAKKKDFGKPCRNTVAI